MPSRRPAPPLQLKKTPPSCASLWFGARPLKHVAFKMQLATPRSPRPRDAAPAAAAPGALAPHAGPSLQAADEDLTGLLSDELLLRILSHLPPPLRDSAGLVCKRWLLLLGRLSRSLTLLDWSFLDGPSRRLDKRFPELTEVDLVPASIAPPVIPSGILLTRGPVSALLESEFEESNEPLPGFLPEHRFLPPDTVDRGLEILAQACPGLQKLSLVAVASELGMLKVSDELHLHWCTDLSLRPVYVFTTGWSSFSRG